MIPNSSFSVSRSSCSTPEATYWVPEAFPKVQNCFVSCFQYLFPFGDVSISFFLDNVWLPHDFNSIYDKNSWIWASKIWDSINGHKKLVTKCMLKTYLFYFFGWLSEVTATSRLLRLYDETFTSAFFCLLLSFWLDWSIYVLWF